MRSNENIVIILEYSLMRLRGCDGYAIDQHYKSIKRQRFMEVCIIIINQLYQ